MINRRLFLTSLAATPSLLALTPAYAMKPEIFASRGIAIRGYDPVAYFKEKRAVRGDKKFETNYKGATFRFANAENLTDFITNPERFAPQYGGYCAWAVSHGYTASIDPDAWTIEGDKLYLNYSLRVRAQWEADKQNRIRLADENWPAVLNR